MQLRAKDLGPGSQLECAGWYAVYTKHQHERKSAELLSRKGMEVFLPMYQSVRQWKDRRKALSLPLFPSYVFLKTNLANRLQILETAGVFFLVESNGRTCLIPDEEIEAIRSVTRCNLNIQPHVFLQRGDRVWVRNGALAGVGGILVRVKNQHRVVISVEVLQKAVSVEIDIENVERVNKVKSGQGLLAATAGWSATG
jgi:transcription antitermination factor NusG